MKACRRFMPAPSNASLSMAAALGGGEEGTRKGGDGEGFDLEWVEDWREAVLCSVLGQMSEAGDRGLVKQLHLRP